jgi:hypothetical protein
MLQKYSLNLKQKKYHAEKSLESGERGERRVERGEKRLRLVKRDLKVR